MPMYAARRISDGLLSVITNVPNTPSNLIQRAIDGDGGIVADWEIFILLSEQYDSARQAYPGRTYLNDGIITVKSLTLTSNKAQITADGVDSATLTANTGDATYTGNVTFSVTAPNGTVSSEVVAAIAGVATTTLTTTQVDMHAVKAECIEFGRDEITVEGI